MAVNASSYSGKYSSSSFPLYKEMGRGANTGSVFPDTMEGACYIEKINRGDRPGISLKLDFIIKPVSGYTEAYSYVNIYIRRYNVATGKWSDWTKMLNKKTMKISGPTQHKLWSGFYGVRGPYGFICGGKATKGSVYSSGTMKGLFSNFPEINPNYWYYEYSGAEGVQLKNASLETFKDILQDGWMYRTDNSMEGYYYQVDYAIMSWNSTRKAGTYGPEVKGQQIYLYPQVFGTRYMSNSGWVSRNSGYDYFPNSVGSWRDYKAPSKRDYGAGPNKESFDYTSVAGESHWQLRFEWVSDYGGTSNWYFPTDSSTSDLNKIDNALLGIPDYCNDNTKEGWPKRYDAKFYKKQNSSGFSEIISSGMYKYDADGGWKVF